VPEFMPKIPLPLTDNFITYHNLKDAPRRMSQILQKFDFTSFARFSAT